MIDLTGRQLGNYRLVKLLGMGGFASVYLGQHMHIATQQAAIKVLYLAQVNTQQFRQEAETIAALKHPHIVRLLDFDIQQGTPFLVLDYAPNGSLATRHPAGEQLPLSTVVQYVTQIADALQYAHDGNIIHRDIKPDNVLIDQRGTLLLSDFGIAVISKTGRKTRSVTHGTAGTPYYMAPEMFRGKPEKASDQYSLAVMVYQWLCGTLPFSEGDIYQLWYQHAHEQPTPPTQHNPNIPGYVEQAILKAIAKQPEGRYSDVSAFMVALQSAPTENMAITTNGARLICPICGFQDRSGAKFCKRDGRRLIQGVMVAPSQNPTVIAGKSRENWLREGDTFRDRKQYEEALKAYEEAIRLDPTYASVHNDKGNALYFLKRYKEALKAYEEAIRLDPTCAFYHSNRGTALYILKRYKEALKAYEEASRLDPTDAFYHSGRGHALYDLKRYEEALKAYEEASRLNPTYAFYYSNRGHALYDLKRYEEALKAYEEAIRLDPTDALAHNGKDRTLVALKDSQRK
jgi:serine/threonine protein kinase